MAFFIKIEGFPFQNVLLITTNLDFQVLYYYLNDYSETEEKQCTHKIKHYVLKKAAAFVFGQNIKCAKIRYLFRV